MQALATVTRISVSNVYNTFKIFIQRYKSEKTRTEYTRDINEFFQFMHGKTVDQLSKHEVEHINENDEQGKPVKLLNMHVEEFKSHLKNKNSDSSVIRKIYAIRALYKFLEINGYDVNHIIFDSSTLKKKTRGYGFYSIDEVKQVTEEALLERNGDELSACYLLAAVTSLRLNALLNLEWSNISKDLKSGLYLIDTVDKGEQDVIAPFDQDLYDKLIEIREKNSSSKLFPNLKVDKVEKSLHRINDRLGFSKTRKLTPHSLRKVAINYGVNVQKDIKAAQEQGGHKSVQVMLDNYSETDTDYTKRAGIQMMKKVDEDIFDLVDKKELLEMLKEMDVGAYQQLALKIQRMIE